MFRVFKEQSRTRGFGTRDVSRARRKICPLYTSELLYIYKLKMYQEIEIPKRGKHSMSQDLIALSFLLLDFFFSFYCYQFAGDSDFLHFQ